MASLLDAVKGSVGVILGGTVAAATAGVNRTTSAATDTLASIIGGNVNKGVNLIGSIAPKSAAASPAPALISMADLAPSNRNVMLLAAAAALALYLVFKK